MNVQSVQTVMEDQSQMPMSHVDSNPRVKIQAPNSRGVRQVNSSPYKSCSYTPGSIQSPESELLRGTHSGQVKQGN